MICFYWNILEINLNKVQEQFFIIWFFYPGLQHGIVDKSIETDFRSTSSDKNCRQIWQQLQRQGQGGQEKE